MPSPPSLSSSPALQGERVAFTGVLASMTHAQAGELTERHGGEASEHISRQTTMLVVGEEGWPLENDGRPSVKLQEAQRILEAGGELRIISESDFLQLLGLTEGREESRRLYTPAMLSQLLDTSVHVIRGWERAGLIRSVRKVYRLPYFDFQEAASARRLSELLASGVPREELERSLRDLPGVKQGQGRPLEQLRLLAHHQRVVVRDDHGLKEPASGQRLLAFDPQTEDEAPDEESEPAAVPFVARTTVPDWSATDWFEEGCRRYADEQLDGAVEAFRCAVMQTPAYPEAHFHLAECLYRSGALSGALERYYAAVEHDHDYLEAWTQLGCLLTEMGDAESAADAFRIALDVHPEFPDAHYHLADLLTTQGRDGEARPHWEAFLAHNPRGPWADLARQHLSLDRE
ncbi:MAG: tetratricopeptide repeat protein [Planctomyces sp.]|nr:tetratricopeptide repeat protein [Planctomyces sp.]